MFHSAEMFKLYLIYQFKHICEILGCSFVRGMGLQMLVYSPSRLLNDKLLLIGFWKQRFQRFRSQMNSKGVICLKLLSTERI